MAITAAEGRGRILSLRSVTKTYTLGEDTIAALAGVNLEMEAGDFLAVVGKSGSGKSTLLNMITGIDSPTSGELWVQGRPVHGMSESERVSFRGRNIGIVFQFFQLIPTLTILENVILPMDFCGKITARLRRARAMELLEKAGIPEQARKFPSMMSGGQQQRAAIARALANDPPVICADEPTGNLDSETSARILELFRALNREGKTIVIVSHEPELRSYARREIRMTDGRITSDEALHAALGTRSSARPVANAPAAAGKEV
jgi:putative ABC transport system ATP-binding protein